MARMYLYNVLIQVLSRQIQILNKMFIQNSRTKYGKYFIPKWFYPRANGAKRRSGRKPGARVTNSARLFTPGKMRTQRSVKSNNDRGRVTLVHGWTSH